MAAISTHGDAHAGYVGGFMSTEVDLSRRSFFKRAGKKITETAVEVAEKKLQPEKINWIRPPFAIDELELLLSCTRCGACVDACDKDVIFPLPKSFGMKVAGTPAMDLQHKACALCTDWPCVDSCINGVLTKLNHPQTDQGGQRYIPKMASMLIDTERCLPYFGPECGYCVDICPVPGAMRLEMNKPVIDDEKCVGCAQCRDGCVTDPSSISVRLLHS